MSKRLSDRLAPKSAGAEKNDVGAIATRIKSKVIDRIDHAALSQFDEAEKRTHLRSEIEQLLDQGDLKLSTYERQEVCQAVLDEILGLGPLEALLGDPAVSDILVNGPDTIYVERHGRLERANVRFRNGTHLVNTISRIAAKVGRRVDESSPIVDARLPDGSRVNAIIPPLALDGAALSIRRFGTKALSIDDLVGFGAMNDDMRNYLRAAVIAKCNILVSGGTGAGKTTLLNALSNFVPDGERVITLEDSAELQLQGAHTVRLESRPANMEGRGQITIGDLMKNALRMRPDRIIVGEVRGGEALDMLQAMNTGHEGSMGTLHANSPDDALQRLVTMITMGGGQLPPKTLNQIIGRTLHVIVQAARLPDGSRRITSIMEVLSVKEGEIETQEVFIYDRTGMDSKGRIIGEHAYISESAFLDKFYRVGALTPPKEGY
ncbi:MAG: pilus assembly protein CpaF [Myxococcales bacterium]|nr:pilus assembly protein CpaF [Myxococcales bacterium]